MAIENIKLSAHEVSEIVRQHYEAKGYVIEGRIDINLGMDYDDSPDQPYPVFEDLTFKAMPPETL